MAAPGQTAPAQQAAPAPQAGCRVTGQVTAKLPGPPQMNFGRGQGGGPNGGGAQAGAPATAPTPTLITTPLPGASLVVYQGTRLVVATSTEADGKYAIRFTPGQTFHVVAEMMAFNKQEMDITLGTTACDQTMNFELALLPRTAPAAAAKTPTAAGAAGTTASAPAGRAGAVGPATQGGARGFAQLNVNQDATGAAAVAQTVIDPNEELAKFLPPGFSQSGASAEAVSVSGGSDAVNVDRGMLNDRMGAIGRGEFDPATGQFSDGFGPAGGPGGPGGPGGDQGGGGRGGGPGGGGGFGGPGGFALGGRGGRGQSLYQGTVNYSFAGSALNTVGQQPRNGVITEQSQTPYGQNNYGFTIGGPLIIPGIYADTKRRTSFQLNYSGSHNTQAQDLYATVPTDAQRAGDFSSAGVALINPATGKAYAGNQIPVSQMSPAALALLAYIPRANVTDATANNLHTSGKTLSTSNSISLRFNQNLTPNLPEPTQPGQRGGGGGGRGGGAPGGGRGGGRGLSINLSVQVQYRGNKNESFNVIPQLNGTTKSTSLTVPVSLTVAKGRTNNTLSVNFAHSNNESTNSFSNAINVASTAGIRYPATQDPLNWGLPNLTFSNFNVRPSAANQRTDNRLTVSYTLSHPINNHQLRFGADFRSDTSSSMSNGNARGSFTFTGLYTGNGALVSRNTGADFADFLLGMPQQATLQVGGTTRLRQRSFSAYLEDNWQRNARMTVNWGLRWEVWMPYVETNGQMANLDVSNGFTAASVVTPGQTGASSGTSFPAGLIKTDWNNVGPRVGVAYRIKPGLILNTSYSITYNSQSYASIARNLVGQPPFAVAETNSGTLASPLSLATGLLGGTATTTNNYGVDPNFGLGLIQTWNATVSRSFWRIWSATVGYTGTRGSNLDLLRAPNRNADGTLRIPGVQAFTWESSGGHSLMNLANITVQRGMAKGFRAGASYTLSKSKDNASSLGAGGTTVAQNDQDLEAEWALSNFDRRHQFSANLTWELPFGVGRRWFSNGGWLSAIVGEWSATFNFTAQSGSRFTPRVVGATTSVANGTSGSLRANYSGAPITLSDPSLTQFFDTSVFSVPAAGTFGTSPRNVITGPGGHVMNATFSRDMRIGGTRALSLQVNANNLFNTIQWTAIDTNINSNTFGQVTRFAGLRTITLNARLRF